MLNFECDYNNGCHPLILQRLVETNDDLQSGYGFDDYTVSARRKIREACGCPDADVFFISGGTQTNLVVISALLDVCEGAVAAETGHIGGHEAGAVEATGHKIMSVPQHNGKIKAEELADFLSDFYSDDNHNHMAFPGLVYISFPTELGTIYTKKELESIHSVCQNYEIPLFIDGARLGYGLMSQECDLDLKTFATLCDVFYIGGTKVGALCGEAVVFPRGNAPKHFFTTVKQHGALLAKGRLCGIQFDTLFTDNLYFKIAHNAIEKAERLKRILHDKGFTFYLETATNQQFVVIENNRFNEIRGKVKIDYWGRYDAEHTIARFCTSWATTDKNLDDLEAVL